jgi:hypothetical protein
MSDTHCRFSTSTIIALSSILISASACDSSSEPDAVAVELPEDDDSAPAQRVRSQEWGRMSVPEIAEEAGQILAAQIDPAKFGCKLDTFQFRLINDMVAIATPPDGFFTPFPHGIPNFDAPALEDAYVFLVTMRDLNNNVVGFASEQEVVDLVANTSKTSYTITLPARGTLMLTERESFQVLIDAANQMVADEEYVRTFDPPLVEVLTIPGTGRVVGGSGEFAHSFGLMQEIGIIYKIDLLNNEFDVGVIVQALHCSI